MAGLVPADPAPEGEVQAELRRLINWGAHGEDNSAFVDASVQSQQQEATKLGHVPTPKSFSYHTRPEICLRISHNLSATMKRPQPYTKELL